jgi:hypothetical protein
LDEEDGVDGDVGVVDGDDDGDLALTELLTSDPIVSWAQRLVTLEEGVFGLAGTVDATNVELVDEVVSEVLVEVVVEVEAT